MIAGQGDRRQGLKSRTLYEAKRARDGQEEQETDRAWMHAHSKAAGPVSGNFTELTQMYLSILLGRETLGLFE